MLVKEYFALLQQALAKSPFTCSQQVSFDARSDYIGVVRGILIFEDESTLHFTECVNTGHQVQKLKYRYQYQSADGITIFPQCPLFRITNMWAWVSYRWNPLRQDCKRWWMKLPV